MPPAGSNKPGPGSNKPGPGNVTAKGAGLKTSEPKKVKVVQDDRDIFQEILAKEREISPWNAAILPTFAVLLLGSGITCIIVGGVRGMSDLIVLGAMFLIGAVVFGFMMFVLVCRPYCSRNQVNVFEDNETVHAYKPAPTSQFTDYFNADMDEDLTQAGNKPGPSENQLYGNARSALSTPATTTNVHFESETDTSYGSPPPPPIAIPSEAGKRNPVYNLDIDAATKRTQEMSDLELL